jgi:hypothetical protein
MTTKASGSKDSAGLSTGGEKCLSALPVLHTLQVNLWQLWQMQQPQGLATTFVFLFFFCYDFFSYEARLPRPQWRSAPDIPTSWTGLPGHTALHG